MKRPHWYRRHPPACTCVQCQRDRLGRLDTVPERPRRPSSPIRSPRSGRITPVAPRRDKGSGNLLIPIILIVMVIIALALVFVEPLRTDVSNALSSLSDSPTVSVARPEPTPPSREDVRERAEFLSSQLELMKWGLLSCLRGQRLAFESTKDLERKYPDVHSFKVEAVGRLEDTRMASEILDEIEDMMDDMERVCRR